MSAGQHEIEQVYGHLVQFIALVEQSDLGQLHDITDRIEVELLIGHLEGARKHLHRAAADLCHEGIKEKEAKQKKGARPHHESIAARMKLLYALTRDILKVNEPKPKG